MTNEIILVGGGGHCKACIDIIELEGTYSIAGIVDIKENLDQKVLGYKIIATDDELSSLVKKYRYFLVTLGQIKSAQRRIQLFENIKSFNALLPVIVSPHAYVSRHASIGEGTIIMHAAVVNAQAVVGRNCIINSKALIEHDAIIHDHCHVSTGSIVNGGAVIEEGSFIGSNSVIREGVKVERQSVIGLHSKIY
jgi:sugar O-acyltransferase (sialic acid O-acetyltransferase NeuD family)